MNRLQVLLFFVVMSPGAFAATTQPAGPTPTPADIRDIHGPLPIADHPAFALTGGLLLLAGGLLLVRRKIHRHQPIAIPSPSVTDPDPIELLARLAADFRQGVCAPERLIIQLDGLVRSTLAARMGIPAQRLTSAELRAQAAPSLNPEHQALLGSLLLLCDRGKFAGHRPDAGEAERTLATAANLINGALTAEPA